MPKTVWPLLLAALALPAAEPGPGFLNVEHAEGPGRLLSAGYRETNYDEDGEAYTHVDGIFAGNIGRTTVIDVHRGWLVMAAEAPGALKPGRYSTIDHRIYDISDPGNPVLVEAKGGQAGYHTHGSRKSGNIWRSGTGWTIDDAGDLSGEAFRRWPKAGHDSSWTGWSRSFEWSYGIPKDPYWIARWDDAARDWVTYGTDPAKPWNIIADTGVIGFGFIVGNILIKVADQSQTGVATYDITDPAEPVLLDVIQTEHGIGSYWPSIWKHWALTERDGVLTAIDFGDPTDLRVTEIPFNDSAVGGPGEGTSHHATYGQLQDHFYFVDRFKVDLRPLESGGEPVIVQALPRTASLGAAPGSNTAAGIGTSQWALPVGNTWISGGYAAAQGAAIWLHDPDPSTPAVCEADTVGPTVGYHIPQDGQQQCSTITPIVLLVHETIETSNLLYGETVFLRVADDSDPVTGDTRVDCLDILFSMDDFLTIAPKEHLQPGTTYDVILTTDALTDAVGNSLQDQTGPGDTIVVDGVSRDIAYRFSFTTSDGSNSLPRLADLSFTPAAPVALDEAGEAAIELRFSASDPDDDTLDYLVDFGDGSVAAPSESNGGSWAPVPADGRVALSHTYTRVGNWRVLVRVRERVSAEQGTYRLASRSITVPVITAPPPSLPRQTSTVAIDETGTQAWAVNPDNDSVARIDLSDEENYHLIEEVAVGRHPAGVAIDGQGRTWVACRDDDSIHVIGRDGSTIASFDPGNSALRYGDRPVTLLFAQDGSTGYAVLEGASTLLLLDGGDTPAVRGRAPQRHGLNVEVYDFQDGIATVDDLIPTNPFPQRTGHNFRVSTGTWSGGLDNGAAQELLEGNIRMDEEHHLFFRQRYDGSIGMAQKFGLVQRGWLEIAPGEVPADGGPVAFDIESSGAVRLTINGQVVADNTTDRSDKRDPLLTASGSITLMPGRHAIELRQVEQTSSKVLTVRYAAAGIDEQVVPARRLFPREEQRQLGAAALNWDGSRLLVAQRISDDHGGRVAQFDTAAGQWREQPWFLYLDWNTPPSPTATAGLPNYVAGLAFGFDPERAWYVAEKAATHFGLARGHGPKDVDHPTFETSVRFLAGQIDLQAEHHVFAEPWNGSDPAWRVDIDNFGQPSAIAVSPFGNQLVIAEQGMNRVLVLDAVSGRELDRAAVGLAPQGLAIRQGPMAGWRSGPRTSPIAASA